MPAPDRLPSAERGIRILRLMAALSVILALIAVVTVVRGEPASKSNALIIVAIALGGCALVGMAILTLSHTYRRKERK